MREASSSVTGLSRSTTISAPSPATRRSSKRSSATCSSAGHPARTSAAPAAALAWSPEPGPDYGGNTSASSTNSGHPSSSPKTPPGPAAGGSLRSHRRWPRSGTGGHTFVSELATSDISTSATACSSLLPTLTACGRDNTGGARRDGARRPSLQTLAREGLLPTLKVSDVKSGDRRRAAAGGRVGRNGRWWNADLRDLALTANGGGLLCPRWAERFMGFPIGWTDSAASQMPSSPSKAPQRSNSSRPGPPSKQNR